MFNLNEYLVDRDIRAFVYRGVLWLFTEDVCRSLSKYSVQTMLLDVKDAEKISKDENLWFNESIQGTPFCKWIDEVTCAVSEVGFYRLLLTSTTEAIKFRDWLINQHLSGFCRPEEPKIKNINLECN
jgi:prophage antirepressor-like protein